MRGGGAALGARRLTACFALSWSCTAGLCLAQTVTQRGFVETRGTLFPQDARNDTQNGVLDLLAREEAYVVLAPWVQFAAGVDVRLNSHDQVSMSWRPDFRDRQRQRPALSIRRLSSTMTRGPVTLEVGKQFIRWGKTDLVTPTDRFAPRDFLDLLGSEFLPVTGARLTLQANDETVLEAVWVPFFTPSRIPLLHQRWTAAPPVGSTVLLTDAETAFPTRAQVGARWAHTGAGYEYSLSVFDGFNHLPDIATRPGVGPFELEIVRRYPALRMYGGDAAVPTPWFTAKGEAAYFTSSTPDADDYILYVVQLERQTGEWLMTGGYAGEVVTKRRATFSFAPDRGLTRSFVARASYTIDPNRSAAVEGAVRENGRGLYASGEYSWTRGAHWRTSVTAALLAGTEADFLGQYRRNSHLALALRYSF